MINRILSIARNRFRDLRRDDSGAALLITLGVFLFLVMCVGGVYAIGETVRQRIELQNAVDASAYSAANVQADALSRMATVNRAMSWCYVQMCNRQMDYIVGKWLENTAKQFQSDRKMAKEHYKHVKIYITHECDAMDCTRNHSDRNGKGWWCGAPHNDNIDDPEIFDMPDFPNEVTPDAVRLNRSVRSTKISDINDAVQSANLSGLKSAIQNDRKTIQALNKLLESINETMPAAIEQVAVETLRQNLRLRNVSSSEAENVLEDYNFHVQVPRSGNPYEKQGGSFFLPLYNTEEHETLFLAMADGCKENENSSYNKTLLDYFGVSSKVPNGFDHWYIRGHADEFAKDAAEVTRNATIPSPGYGITRGYKNANFKEGGDRLRVGYYAPLSLIANPPSCQNYRGKKDNYLDLCKTAYDSYDDEASLVSEYVWGSGQWICVCVNLLLVRFCFHLPVPWMMSTDCKGHEGYFKLLPFGLDNCARSKYKQCILALNLFIRSDSEKKWIPFTGNARIYGDDKAVYEKDLYTTETCKPWILKPSFFNGDGSILVFASRKMRNPLAYAFTGAKGSNSVKGIFSAFNPSNSYMWASAASRAGVHRIGGKPNEYEVTYNGVCHVWHPTDDKSVFGVNSKSYGEGCVCGKTERLKNIWNLCTPDWEATLLPMRFAQGFSSPFDGTPEGDFSWQADGSAGDFIKQAAEAEWGSLSHTKTHSSDRSTVQGKKITGIDHQSDTSPKKYLDRKTF